MKNVKVGVQVAARLVLGWMFFWAFIDKLFGLGFATKTADSWLNGGSPTSGYLSHVSGTFAGLFQAMAGNPVVDWLFMLGLLGVGVGMLLGIQLRWAGYAGALMALLMWLSAFPSANNPLIDEHVLYTIVFFGLAYSDAGMHFGLGKRWPKWA